MGQALPTRSQPGAGVSRWSERPVLFALFLLSFSCKCKPLLLLLLKPCPGDAIRGRSCSGCALEPGDRVVLSDWSLEAGADC